MSDRRRFLKGLTSLPLATVLACVRYRTVNRRTQLKPMRVRPSVEVRQF